MGGGSASPSAPSAGARGDVARAAVVPPGRETRARAGRGTALAETDGAGAAQPPTAQSHATSRTFPPIRMKTDGRQNLTVKGESVNNPSIFCDKTVRTVAPDLPGDVSAHDVEQGAREEFIDGRLEAASSRVFDDGAIEPGHL